MSQVSDYAHLARLKIAARTKYALLPAGDPALGGAPPGGDPSMGGGGMPPGGDPMAAGGAPPAPPPPAPMPQANPMAMGGGMVEPIKPKIDVNVEMMQIKKMLARICDHLQIPIPASDMAVTSQDLTANAMGQTQQPAGQAAGGAGAIPPISPIQPAMGGGGGDGKTAAAVAVVYSPGVLTGKAAAARRLLRR